MWYELELLIHKSPLIVNSFSSWKARLKRGGAEGELQFLLERSNGYSQHIGKLGPLPLLFYMQTHTRSRLTWNVRLTSERSSPTGDESPGNCHYGREKPPSLEEHQDADQDKRYQLPRVFGLAISQDEKKNEDARVASN